MEIFWPGTAHEEIFVTLLEVVQSIQFSGAVPGLHLRKSCVFQVQCSHAILCMPSPLHYAPNSIFISYKQRLFLEL
jgi:hypothetical protein